MSKAYLARLYVHGEYEQASKGQLDEIKYEHLYLDYRMFESSDESDKDEPLTIAEDVSLDFFDGEYGPDDPDDYYDDRMDVDFVPVPAHRPYKTRRFQRHHVDE